MARRRYSLRLGPNLDWLVNQKEIAPHVPVIDKSKRQDGTFSRKDFHYERDAIAMSAPPAALTTTGRVRDDHSVSIRLHACRECPLKTKCCPKMPPRRKVRDMHEAARDVARARQNRGLRANKALSQEG